MDIRNKELKNTKEFIMKHAIATFIFVASIAGFGGVANALPIIYATDGDPSKNVALEQDVDNFILHGESILGGGIALQQEADDAMFRGGSIRGGSIALDQGANEWNHFVPRGGFKVALDQGANQWNHRGDDDWGCNPRRVL